MPDDQIEPVCIGSCKGARRVIGTAVEQDDIRIRPLVPRTRNRARAEPQLSPMRRHQDQSQGLSERTRRHPAIFVALPTRFDCHDVGGGRKSPLS